MSLAGSADDRTGGVPRAVVLGGTGFLGRHTCAALAASGYQVLAVARRSVPVPPGVRCTALDLGAVSAEALRAFLCAEHPAVVVNASGGVWDVTETEMERANAHLVAHLMNVLGTLPRRPRVVHLGSVHEYGPVPASTSIGECTEPRPVSAYGRTKLAGSNAVLAAARDGRLDTVVLRIANAIGPGTPRGSLLGRVAEQLNSAGPGGTAVLRLSPLRSSRDFIDVRDIADAVVAAAGTPGASGVLNIGRGQAISVRWLVDRLVAASGIPARLLQEEDVQQSRSADVDWQQVDSTAARAKLGWAPRRSLDESVEDLWSEVSGAHAGPRTAETTRKADHRDTE